MTTYDPDTQEQDLSVLRRLVEEFDGRMALDCAVIQGGRLTGRTSGTAVVAQTARLETTSPHNEGCSGVWCSNST